MAALLYASRLPNAAYEIVLVASNNPEAGGLILAQLEGVPIYALSHKGMARADHEAAMQEALMDSGAEFVVLAGYMRVLGEAFVSQWEGRMLNIHPSLLPKYKGLDTHQRALDAGDSEAGCSVHLVTPELDAGEVLGQIKLAIRPDDNAQSLAARVLIAEHQLYPAVVSAYVSRRNDPTHLLQKLRKLALAMPQVHERESHGSPGWRVGSEKSGKYFAHFSDRHHGHRAIAVLVKTDSMDELLQLVETQPEVYYKPAYYGASGWVGLILNRAGVDWDHVADWMERSWRACAPKSAVKLMDAAEQF